MYVWLPNVPSGIAPAAKNDDMDTRRFRYTIRLTEHENISLAREMELLGYRSVAKYFRDMAMKKHSAIATCKKNADNIIQEKLVKFRADFNKLGANYNQIVKRYNAIVRDAISKDCISVSLYSLGFHTQKLEELTLAMIRLFIRIEKEVAANRDMTSPDALCITNKIKEDGNCNDFRELD